MYLLHFPAARACLVIQNLSVSICATILSIYLTFGQKHGETLRLVTIVAVIVFSSVARLATTGTNIIMQKDWIVVIAGNDRDMLAGTSCLSAELWKLAENMYQT